MVVAVIAAIGVLLLLARRRGEPKGSDEAADAGLAILEFGRAFPDEPVRDVIMTADGQSAFLRLADGRTGFLHAMGRHYVTHLIPPGGVEIEGRPGERSLVARFRDSSFKGGTFTFSKVEEAAEVSVWLLGSFAIAAGKSETSQG